MYRPVNGLASLQKYSYKADTTTTLLELMAFGGAAPEIVRSALFWPSLCSNVGALVCA